MTAEQLGEIVEKLKLWKEERHLDTQKQLAGLTANLLEECVEYLRAQDNNEKIDALCDICVFSLNAIENLNINSIIKLLQNKLDELSIAKSLIGSADSTHSLTTYTLDNILDHIQRVNLFLGNRKLENQYSSCDMSLSTIVSISLSKITTLGYDPYRCMLETIKEISSRKGNYDTNIKKFVKDPGAYDKAGAYEIIQNIFNKSLVPLKIIKEDDDYWYFGVHSIVEDKIVKWYKANYDLCKLEEAEQS